MTALDTIRSKFKFDSESPWYFYRKVILWSFIISSCITIPFVLVEFIKTGSAVFLYYGDYNGQQICFYENCVRMVQEGSFGWDWVTDLGSNFIGSYSYYMLGSPFFWIMCAFPSTWAPYLMAPVYIIKYIVAAVTGYAYLQRFVKNKNYAVIGALLYSFSGFQIYNIFFNQFHDVVALFPLLLIGMEEYVQNDRKGLFAVAVALNALVNYFMFAGQVVFCVIYFFFRLTTISFKITLPKFIGLVLEAVMGVLMSMFLFLPAAASLMGNYRISSSYTGTITKFAENLVAKDWAEVKNNLKTLFVFRSSGEPYWYRYGHILESYFFPPDIPSRVNFFYGHGARWSSISMYLPMFSMSGVFAFFTVKGRKWLKWLISTLVVFSFVPILNSSFFLFNTSYYARWLYMMILMFSLATAIALEDMRSKWKVPTFIMTVCCTAIVVPLGLLWHENDSGTTVLGHPPYRARFWIYSAIAFLGIALTAYLIRKFRGTKLFERAVLISLSAVTVLYSCVHIINGKQHSQDSNFLVDQCIEGDVDLPDPHEEFSRIDFYFSSKISTIDNLGIYWNYPTLECFHTIVPASIMDFYPVFDINRSVRSRIASSYYGIRSFTSVKYSLIETSKNKKKVTTTVTDPETGKKTKTTKYVEAHDAFGFEYLESQNGFDIYENKYFIPMGFAYTQFMTETDFESAYAANERDDVLCTYMVVPDDMAAYYAQFMEQVLPQDAASPSNDTFVESVAERRQMCCYEFDYDSYGFNASIELDKPAIVYFSVPYEDNGWSATVNGKETDVLKVSYSFVAVECEAGVNEIEFSYTTPGLFVPANITLSEMTFAVPGGVWISLFGIALFAIYMFYFKKVKKHKAETKFFSFEYYDDMNTPLPEDLPSDLPDGEPEDNSAEADVEAESEASVSEDEVEETAEEPIEEPADEEKEPIDEPVDEVDTTEPETSNDSE